MRSATGSPWRARSPRPWWVSSARPATSRSSSRTGCTDSRPTRAPPTTGPPAPRSGSRHSSGCAGAASLAHRDDHLDLDGDPAGERAHADRRARVATALAEHLDEEIGTAVDHLRMVLELGGRIDHAEHLDDLLDPIEIAAKRIAHGCDQHQSHRTRVPIAFLDRHAGAELALGHSLRGVRTLAREIEQIADALGVHVAAERRADLGE